LHSFIRWTRRSLPALALVAAAPLVVSGQTMTFTHGAFGAFGSLGGVAFTEKAFTITGTGNLANLKSRLDVNGNVEQLWIDHDVASVAIDGLGSFSFLTGTRTFFNPITSTAGFGRDLPGLDLFTQGQTLALLGWDMKSAASAFSIAPTFQNWSSTPVQTSGGALVIGGLAGFPVGVFGAALSTEGSDPSNPGGSGPVTTVPEPSSLALLALGGAALLVRQSSRRRAACDARG
jgi:hypothetical protein